MATIWLLIHVLLFYLSFPNPTSALGGGGGDVKEGGGGYFPVPATAMHGTLVKRDQRWLVASSAFGEITAVKMSDGKDGFYHLQFITMEPGSLFLPVHLHSDMVFFVDSGNGTLSWTGVEQDYGELRQVNLQAGDVYRLRSGSFFYLQNNLEFDRQKLRINAIFSDSKEELLEGSSSGAYSSVRDLVLGFDSKILQAALNVKEEVIEELKQGERQAIVHGVAETVKLKVHYGIMRALLGGRMNINGVLNLSKKKEKDKKDEKDKKEDDKEKPYNVFDAKHDVENCNGWSLVVTSEQLDALNDSNFGVFMVNLTKAAMMGPHWNPTTAEIAVVLRGRGMVNVVCPSATNGTECKNSRFKVEEGDTFVVPRYHPMAQMSFNNESLIFVGFTTTQKKNHPQFLVGKASVLQALDKEVLAASLGVSNTTMDQVLSAQREAIILECVSCAEEEERLVDEEIAREREEARKREEEVERKKEEEEAKRQEEEKRKKEEEEARKREEEEARRQEEEKRKKEEEEEARKREEEEARRQEEEKRKKEEEEEARKREEEARRQEEEARKREEEARRQEEEAAARQREEEAARRWKEEEEAKRKREEEAAKQWQQQQEEAAKRKQEEAARKREEEAARQREEEAARRQKEEEAAKQWQRQQEEEAKRKQETEAAKQWQRQQEEEAKRKQEEAARKREEAAARQQEEEEAARRWKEEAARRQKEEEAAKQWQRQQEEEAKRKREEEAAKQWQRQQEEEAKRKREEEAARHQHGGGGGGGAAEWEGDASRRKEEEMARRQREAEAASERGGGGGGWQGRGRYEN